MFEIVLNRGDTVTKKLTITDSEGNELKVDEIYFTVKSTTEDEEYIFQKTISSGDITYDEEEGAYLFTILPEDTNDLSYKTYVCDIQVYREDPLTKKTILGTFNIQDEVTWAINE